jgi:acetolactate decarboxylase
MTGHASRPQGWTLLGRGRRSAFALALSLLAGGALSPAAARERSDAVYVSAPFVGLLEGLFDGDVSIAELARHGDIGLGALDASDGELILLDGQAYQAKGDGAVTVRHDSERTPFAMSVFFEADRTIAAGEVSDLPALRALLDRELEEASVPLAFRIEGTFASITTRSVHRQQVPYRRLIEVIKEQVVLEQKDVSGTIVGFRMPDYTAGLSIPGYHFHFVSAERKTGGHVLAFRSGRLRIAVDRCSGIDVNIPQSPAFSRVHLSPASQAEIDQILGRAPVKP